MHEPLVLPLPGAEETPEARPEQVASLAASPAEESHSPEPAAAEPAEDRAPVVPRRIAALG